MVFVIRPLIVSHCIVTVVQVLWCARKNNLQHRHYMHTCCPSLFSETCHKTLLVTLAQGIPTWYNGQFSLIRGCGLARLHETRTDYRWLCVVMSQRTKQFDVIVNMILLLLH